MSYTLDELLARVDHQPLEGQDRSFVADMAWRYVHADEPTRADFRAFIDCDGPRRVHEVKLKHQKGIPTSEDLERWVE